jgi:hypothetical protein
MPSAVDRPYQPFDRAFFVGAGFAIARAIRRRPDLLA